MSDHPLASLRVTDSHHGGARTVSFDGEILTVHFRRDDHGNYSWANEERYFRLTEVKQTWTEVE